MSFFFWCDIHLRRLMEGYLSKEEAKDILEATASISTGTFLLRFSSTDRSKALMALSYAERNDGYHGLCEVFHTRICSDKPAKQKSGQGISYFQAGSTPNGKRSKKTDGYGSLAALILDLKDSVTNVYVREWTEVGPQGQLIPIEAFEQLNPLSSVGTSDPSPQTPPSPASKLQAKKNQAASPDYKELKNSVGETAHHPSEWEQKYNALLQEHTLVLAELEQYKRVYGSLYCAEAPLEHLLDSMSVLDLDLDLLSGSQPSTPEIELEQNQADDFSDFETMLSFNSS